MYSVPVSRESRHDKGRRLTKPYARQSILLHRWHNGDRVSMHARFSYCAECGSRSLEHRTYDDMRLCRDCFEAIRAADRIFQDAAVAEFAGEER